MSEWMMLGAAATELGMDHRQLRRLIARGVIATFENPMDARSKLLKREDVESLKQFRFADRPGVAGE